MRGVIQTLWYVVAKSVWVNKEDGHKYVAVHEGGQRVTGKQVVRGKASPPTIAVTVPAAAPRGPPLTGQSRRPAMLDCAGFWVVQSTRIWPRRRCGASSATG